MSAPVLPTPAGWYPDPDDPTQGRYWNGVAWSATIHRTGEPLPLTLSAPAGTPWSTPWIWILVAIQVLPLLTALLVPWGSVFAFDPSDPAAASQASLGIYLSPFYWLTTIFGYAVYGFSVLFAYRDHRELLRRGVPRPFHWAFVFIGGAVYVIGRSVVARRRTGDGLLPMWIQIAVIVLSFVLAGVILVQMMMGMAGMFEQIFTR